MKVMKKVTISLLVLLSISSIASCANENVIDIKSPCVSLEDGPCGPKRSINDWWLKSNV